jgi:hypothetical protein
MRVLFVIARPAGGTKLYTRLRLAKFVEPSTRRHKYLTPPSLPYKERR